MERASSILARMAEKTPELRITRKCNGGWMRSSSSARRRTSLAGRCSSARDLSCFADCRYGAHQAERSSTSEGTVRTVLAHPGTSEVWIAARPGPTHSALVASQAIKQQSRTILFSSGAEEILYEFFGLSPAIRCLK